MSLLFFEGFETVGTELGLANQATVGPRVELRWDASGRGGNPVSDSFFLIDDFLSEGFALQMGFNGPSIGNFVQRNTPVSLQGAPGAGATEYIVGMRVHIPSTPRTWKICQVTGKDPLGFDSVAIELECENSADLRVRRGLGGPSIGFAAGVVTAGSWHYIELRFKIADTPNGIIEVKVDGTSQITDTAADTNNFLATDAIFIQWETTAVAGGTDFVAYDDMYLLETGTSPNSNFLGDVRVVSLPPTADASPTNWTTSSGPTHFSLVDENGADAADYIESDTNSQEDMFDTTNLSVASSVLGVKIEAEAINTTGGSPTLDVRVKSGVSVAETNYTVDDTVDYAVFSHLSETDPATGSLWLDAAVDAMNVGVQINSGF